RRALRIVGSVRYRLRRRDAALRHPGTRLFRPAHPRHGVRCHLGTGQFWHGPWAGGWVFDAQASYAWLYIGSFAVGLAAVAVALTFKPRPVRLQVAAAD